MLMCDPLMIVLAYVVIPEHLPDIDLSQARAGQEGVCIARPKKVWKKQICWKIGKIQKLERKTLFAAFIAS